MNIRAIHSVIAGLTCTTVFLGCGSPVEQSPVAEPVNDAAAQPPAQSEPVSVAQQVLEVEAEMNQESQPLEEPQDQTETDSEPEEPRKSPIRIVPTRPMFQNEELQYDEPYQVEYEYEDYDEDDGYETDEGPQITDYHLKNLREQQSLYIIRDLMPVPGRLIDRYYKGRTKYEVWEWYSYSEEKGETLVRIRFIDDDAADIMINPGPYVLMR